MNMEDEDGVELGLALCCGGSYFKRQHVSSDTGCGENDRGIELADDFSSVFSTSCDRSNLGTLLERRDLEKPQEIFFNDLSTTNMQTNSHTNLHMREWVPCGKGASAEETEVLGDKRKMAFDDRNHMKKHEEDDAHLGLLGNQISNNSAGSILMIEKEDAAKSSAVSAPNVVTCSSGILLKTPGISASNEVIADPIVRQLLDERVPRQFLENEPKYDKFDAGISLSVQQDVFSKPTLLSTYIKSNSLGSADTSCPPSGSQLLMFGCSATQYPALDKNSQDSFNHIEQSPLGMHDNAKYTQGGSQIDMQCLPEAAEQDGISSAALPYKDDRKSCPTDEIPHTTDIAKQEASDPSTIDPCLSPAISPGISPDIKFGGSGSYPHLPWVSTTAPSPNGRTISGVTYKYTANQIKIVCACHGSHLTPDEFVQHAREENTPPESGTDLTHPIANPLTSSQS